MAARRRLGVRVPTHPFISSRHRSERGGRGNGGRGKGRRERLLYLRSVVAARSEPRCARMRRKRPDDFVGNRESGTAFRDVAAWAAVPTSLRLWRDGASRPWERSPQSADPSDPHHPSRRPASPGRSRARGAPEHMPAPHATIPKLRSPISPSSLRDRLSRATRHPVRPVPSCHPSSCRSRTGRFAC